MCNLQAGKGSLVCNLQAGNCAKYKLVKGHYWSFYNLVKCKMTTVI